MELKKIARIIVAIISVIAIVFLATILAADDKEGGLIGPFIYLAYVTLIVTVALVLFYTFKNMAAKKSADLKRTFMSIGIFLGIILVSFVIAEGNAIPLKDGGEVSEMASKLVSTGLYTFYFLSFIAVVLMVFSSFNRVKK
jgi:membrane protease YdiL (CAAX protease family)